MRGALLALALAAGVAALPSCDQQSKCTWTVKYKGSPWDFDLRGLCNRNNDYVHTDDTGHTYYAQICGTANKQCLPAAYENEYEYGRVVQAWGSDPPCDNSCVEEATGAPTCCTSDCQVVAVQDPIFKQIDAGDATKGFELFFFGETPTLDDPYPCDYNPVTYQQYPRTTHMQFFCDPNADGFADFYEVDGNSTDDCDYTLKFKTSRACLPGLSGGWAFVIFVLVTGAVYVLGALGWNYHQTRSFGFPPSHARFWSDLNGLIFEGVLFTVAGCKKPKLKVPLAASAAGAASSSVAYASVSSSAAAADATKGAYTDL